MKLTKAATLSLIFLLLGCKLAIAEQAKQPSQTAQTVAAQDIEAFDQTINKLYKTVPASHNKNIATRIAAISQFFLDKPYQLGALGEGPKGKFDQNPLYRTDAFDCVTYASTVIALAQSDSLSQFKQTIKKIRYKNGNAFFVDRNHFTTTDWNKNNIQNGYLQDITHKFVDQEGKPVAVVAETVINKPEWYKALKTTQIKQTEPLSEKQTQQLLTDLHAKAEVTQQEKGVLLYIPLTKLFIDGKANTFLFNQIPSGSIVEIVRPNWGLKKFIGTNLNVSHLGFAVRTEQGLMYREASSVEKKVIDVPLDKYLAQYLDSPTIKGIHVLQVVEK